MDRSDIRYMTFLIEKGLQVYDDNPNHQGEVRVELDNKLFLSEARKIVNSTSLPSLSTGYLQDFIPEHIDLVLEHFGIAATLEWEPATPEFIKKNPYDFGTSKFRPSDVPRNVEYQAAIFSPIKHSPQPIPLSKDALTILLIATYALMRYFPSSPSKQEQEAIKAGYCMAAKAEENDQDGFTASGWNITQKADREAILKMGWSMQDEERKKQKKHKKLLIETKARKKMLAESAKLAEKEKKELDKKIAENKAQRKIEQDERAEKRRLARDGKRNKRQQQKDKASNSKDNDNNKKSEKKKGRVFTFRKGYAVTG